MVGKSSLNGSMGLVVRGQVLTDRPSTCTFCQMWAVSEMCSATSYREEDPSSNQ